MKQISLIAAAMAICTTGVFAQDRPVAPDYYINGVFATSMAQQIALACPTLSVNPATSSTLSGNVLGRLEEDGFDITQLDFDTQVGQQALDQRIAEFAERTGLQSGALTATVCLAGRREIEAQTDVGRLLLEVGN